MNEHAPRLGPTSDTLDPWVCHYSNTPEDLACGVEATWHGIVMEHEFNDGLAGVPSCDAHKPVMEAIADYVHPHETACGLPEGWFDEDANVCVLDEPDLSGLAVREEVATP